MGLAILNEHGIVHRGDKGCIQINAALDLDEPVKWVTDKQIEVYHLPPCGQCWTSLGEFTATLRGLRTK